MTPSGRSTGDGVGGASGAEEGERRSGAAPERDEGGDGEGVEGAPDAPDATGAADAADAGRPSPRRSRACSPIIRSSRCSISRIRSATFGGPACPGPLAGVSPGSAFRLVTFFGPRPGE